MAGQNYGKGTEIYKFEKIKRAKRKALADIPDRKLLDFGIGENDAMAPEPVRARMAAEINRPENRGYADNGIAEFKQAAARFMQRKFGVSLDPATEVNHCIGSKTALAMLPACFINPGDITLMTVPGYPVAGTHTQYYGGSVYPVAAAGRKRFPAGPGSRSPRKSLKRAKLLVLNYPNSPTGKVATPKFYEQVVAFAKAHRLVVIQDAAHIMLTFAGEPLSFLSDTGSQRGGGRSAFAVQRLRHDRLADRLGLRPSAAGPGLCGCQGQLRFGPVHRDSESGHLGFGRSTEIPVNTREKYRRRLGKLVAMLSRCGFDCRMPGGTYFLYTRAPSGASRRDRVRQCGGRQPVPDHPAIDRDRPLG